MGIITFAIINILPVLVVTYVSSYFMKKIYEKNSRYSSKLYFVVWGLFAVFYMLIIQLQLGSVVMTVYGITSMQMISLLYKGKKYKFFYNLLFYMYLIILDIVSIPIISMILNVETADVISIPYFRVATPIISGIIMLGSVRLIIHCLVAEEIDRINKRINFIIFAVLICEAAMLLYGVALSSENLMHNKYFLLSLVFFLAFDVMGIYLYRLMNIDGQLKNELALSKQRDELEYKHLQSLQDEYEKSRKILHDIKNHVLTLERINLGSDGELPHEYIKDLIEKIDDCGYSFKSNSKIITALLSEKISAAKAEHITFSVQVQEVPFEFVSDLDWVTILGNIIDNAIESCLKVPEDKRSINLYIHKFQNMLMIRLENTLSDIPIVEKDRLKSSKEGHVGVGIANVKEVIEKYGGEINFSYDEETFKTRIVIPLP